MPLNIVRNDITKMNTDAVVNAANNRLLAGGGVCGAIFSAAGSDKLTAECRKIGFCKTGSAVITPAFKLKAKYIIHAVGPVYSPDNPDCESELYSCYKSSLELAKRYKLNSIAFPLISSGIYGYPKVEALAVATKAISDFLENNDMTVYIVVYDKKAFEISKELFSDVREYIEERFIEADNARYYTWGNEPEPSMRNIHPHTLMSFECNTCVPEAADNSLDEMLVNMDIGFSEYLMQLIDESGMTDSQVYKKANIDRKLFSKIRTNPQYKPSKVTAVAFAVALELDMEKSRALIEKAGYSLTHSNKFDIIIEYFIQRKDYNIFRINEVLFTFDQPLIGV